MDGPLAQLVEQGTLNPKVVGSIPTRPIAETSAECGIISRSAFFRLSLPFMSHDFISTQIQPERAVLARLILDGPRHDDEEDESSLEELSGLAMAAGAVVVGQATQKRSSPNAATLLAKAKSKSWR